MIPRDPVEFRVILRANAVAIVISMGKHVENVKKDFIITPLVKNVTVILQV